MLKILVIRLKSSLQDVKTLTSRKRLTES